MAVNQEELIGVEIEKATERILSELKRRISRSAALSPMDRSILETVMLYVEERSDDVAYRYVQDLSGDGVYAALRVLEKCSKMIHREMLLRLAKASEKNFSQKE